LREILRKFPPSALTVFYVVQVESLKATSLIHAGRFTKASNATTTTTPPSSSSSSSESPSKDRLREILDEMPDDDDVRDTYVTYMKS
jgi:hypothetical protein